MQDSDKIFEDIAESLPQIVWTASPDGTVTYYNQRWREFTGFPQTEGLGSGWKVALHPEDEARTIEAWRHSVETGEPYEIEHRVSTFGGGYKWVLSKGVPVRDENGKIVKWYGSATDIHKLKETEDKLKVAREKNELLMREVVHRTKNALQLVESLISLQVNKYDNETADVLKKTQSRIRSIALLHQKLNESSNIDLISIRPYFEDLVSLISGIYSEDSKSITFNLHVDDVEIHVDMAVSFGLMINELITNSIKYAFPHHEEGNVKLVLKKDDSSPRIILEYHDNGIGIEDISGANYSLGLQIVYSIVEQHGGIISLNNEKGTHYSFSFPVKNII
jgi:PAS domain S-box-containing protein